MDHLLSKEMGMRITTSHSRSIFVKDRTKT
jgi:hypothetical protein